jgi:hypothetical protein
MSDLISIKVECYSGYKVDEYPRCFHWNNERHEIDEILDRWYQSNINPEWPSANYFKVHTTFDRQYIIKHEIERDEWYLVTSSSYR